MSVCLEEITVNKMRMDKNTQFTNRKSYNAIKQLFFQSSLDVIIYIYIKSFITVKRKQINLLSISQLKLVQNIQCCRVHNGITGKHRYIIQIRKAMLDSGIFNFVMKLNID